MCNYHECMMHGLELTFFCVQMNMCNMKKND
uniref:Uncharacterized protein n=1 Tax=Arundo donax TaxID=35708 RepID=A0A0A9G570_ARUDO